MRIYLPLIIMVWLNLSIIRKMYKSRHRLSQAGVKVKKISPREARFTFLTILFDAIFWIFYAPFSVYLTIGIVNIFSPFQDASNSAAYNLFSNVAQLIAITYHASFFFLNFFFNRIFRNEVLSIPRIFSGSDSSKRSHHESIMT
jgi:hypothetical protein